MTYNMSLISENATNLLIITQNVNDVLMAGWLGTLILFGLFMVMFMGFYYSGAEVNKALLAACWLSFVLSVPLFLMGLVGELVVFSTLITSAVLVAISFKQ